MLIDEYDNFANQVMMGVQQGNQRRYEALVFEEGPLRTLFKVIKSSTRHSMFDRMFMTGVSPVVMSDITSGYNIAENIYPDPQFNDLCGFTHAEVRRAIGDVADACGLGPEDATEALNMMETYYNGYKFSPDARDTVYNPTLVLYFLKAFYQSCKYPRDMLDDNLSADGAKLDFIAQIPGGGQLLLDMVHENATVVVTDMAKRFGIRDLLNAASKDNAFMVSLLYYFGVLHHSGYPDRIQICFSGGCGDERQKGPRIDSRDIAVPAENAAGHGRRGRAVPRLCPITGSTSRESAPAALCGGGAGFRAALGAGSVARRLLFINLQQSIKVISNTFFKTEFNLTMLLLIGFSKQ